MHYDFYGHIKKKTNLYPIYKKSLKLKKCRHILYSSIYIQFHPKILLNICKLRWYNELLKKNSRTSSDFLSREILSFSSVKIFNLYQVIC